MTVPSRFRRRTWNLHTQGDDRVAPINQLTLARSELKRKPEPKSAVAVAGRCFHGGNAGGKHRADT